jgi:type I restriction enzyme R subunit
VGEALFTKARLIKDLGNLAVHSTRKVAPPMRWRPRASCSTSATGWRAPMASGRARAGLELQAELLPKPRHRRPPQTAGAVAEAGRAAAERDQKLTTMCWSPGRAGRRAAEAAREVAAAKKANTAQPDTHDYSEAETRDYFIDLLLKEAGWTLDPAKNFEVEVTGMPNNEGKGFVDYVLWGDDGKPLALVEAKRTTKSAKVGQQQAKLYADCLEAVRPAAGHLLLQRLRALDLGRRLLPAARRAGVLQEGRSWSC